jgi:hypothetical protein
MATHIPARMFLSALKSVAYATANDRTPRLHQILVESTGSTLKLVAADGHRLAMANIHAQGDVWKAAIDADHIAALTKALAPLAKRGEVVSVTIAGVDSLHDGAITLFGPVGDFPLQYEQCFKNYQPVASVKLLDCDELASVTGALKCLTKSQRGIIRGWGDGPLHVEAWLSEHGNLNMKPEVSAKLNATVTGKCDITGVCLKHLHDAAKSLKGLVARLDWSGESDPMVLTACVDCVDVTAVVMPCRI